MFAYSMGEFDNQVLCDVLPIKVCHILLRRPWLFDKKAKHCGFNNAFTFQYHNPEIKMVPSRDVTNLKLKAIDSFLLQHILFGGNKILGPPPNSTGLSSSKRRELLQQLLLGWITGIQYGSPSPRTIGLGGSRRGGGVYIFFV